MLGSIKFAELDEGSWMRTEEDLELTVGSQGLGLAPWLPQAPRNFLALRLRIWNLRLEGLFGCWF